MTAVRIGLTGGIGSGKSTVSQQLAELGALVIDSDLLAREVVAPGSIGLGAVIDRFGVGIVGPDGSLDRPALGALVFGDPEALAALNGIIHPLVRVRSSALEAKAPPNAVVVHDVALLVENDMAAGFDEVWVVCAPLQLRLERLERRGLPREQAIARIQNQASDLQRLAAATTVLDNSGDREHLLAQVDEQWRRLCSTRQG